jgi:amino acid transporter
MKTPTPLPRRLTTIPLVAALYFMVSGGPFGLEELAQKAGFGWSIAILLVTPVVWSLPTALMVGELAAAVPEEGGYYAWVRRAMGPFWGYQEAWLSLAASVFDMAIYPTLFALYLGAILPMPGLAPILTGVLVVVAGVVSNLFGAKSVGTGSTAMTVLVLVPFVALSVLALTTHPAPVAAGAVAHAHPQRDLFGAVLVAMWNYMGWDNASTIAGEVKDPQRTYPVAVIAAVALVAITYVLPMAAMAVAGVDPSSWVTGSWATIGRAYGGAPLALAVVVGGMASAFGMFNALTLSYSRLPVVLAEHGYLPSLFTRRLPNNGAPWVSILVCGAAWTLTLGLSFERLVSLDILLYGTSLVLEFVALLVLRVREPELPRPFRVPGGLLGAAVIGLGPLVLLGAALVKNADEHIAGMSALLFGALVMASGPVAYALTRKRASS